VRLAFPIACALLAGFSPAAEDVAGVTLERSKADGARGDAIKTERVLVRSGATAIRFSIGPGDCVPDDCAADRERVELKARETERVGHRSAYSWSFFLPEDFGSVWPAREFIAQFHQEGGQPAMLLSLEPGGLYFESRFLDTSKPLLVADEALRGRWHDIDVAVEWSETLGSVRISVDGEERFNRVMQTMSEAEAYFKIGLYRAHLARNPDAKKLKQVMVVDAIRRTVP
jgi:Polysaccharide lyase